MMHRNRYGALVFALRCALLCALVGCARTDVRIVSSTDALASTTFVAPLESPLDPTKNTLWCATAPLAWRALTEQLGGPVAVTDGPAWVDALNRSPVGPDDVAAAARVCDAGRVSDGVIDRIERAVRARFNASEPLLASFRALPPDAIVAYARLQKALRFPTPFDRFDERLRFVWSGGEARVASFGVDDYDNGDARHRELRKQVRIHGYTSPEDFAVVVDTKEGDEVVLARLAPAATLRATVDAALARVATAPAEQLGAGDVLSIPRFDFDLTHDYRDIAGKRLANDGFAGASIGRAFQRIRFEMNEEGVTLESTYAVGVMSAVPQKRLVFAGPFVVVLRERGKANPYFAMWVGNGELWPRDG